MLLLSGCTGAVDGTVDRVEVVDEAIALLASDPAAAEEAFAGWVDRWPDDPLLRLGLCRAQLEQARWAEASVSCRLPLALDPGLAEAHHGTAAALAQLGLVDEALGFVQAAWAAGLRDAAMWERDPWLAPLRGDHRFLFFLSTGHLDLSERSAALAVERPELIQGELLTLELAAFSLNRPALSDPEALGFDLLIPDGMLRPLARLQSFANSTTGASEYQRQGVRFVFRTVGSGEGVAQARGLRLDQEPLQALPAPFRVRPPLAVPPPRTPWSAEEARAWLQPPLPALEAETRALARIELERGPDSPEAEARWAGDDEGFVLRLDFLAPDGVWPAGLPRLELAGRPRETLISGHIQRSTFGPSQLELVGSGAFGGDWVLSWGAWRFVGRTGG